MKNQETVCAVVVTYNRKELLIECLDALCKQTRPIDAMYIIDNFSNDGTAELLLENGYINMLPPENLDEPFEMKIDFDNSEFLGAFDDGIEYSEVKLENKLKIHYVRMNENTGGAGGFYEGIKRAYGKGYNWLWIMDDDAEAEINCLENLFNINHSENYSFLAPVIIHKNSGDYELYHHKLKIDLLTISEKVIEKKDYSSDIDYKLEANGFVGPLLNRKAIEKYGSFPDKSFFLWWDDTDYTYGLSQSYGEGKLVNDAKLYHKDKGKQVKIDKNDWKLIYGTRNRIRFFKKHIGYIGKISLTVKLIKQVLVLLLNKKNKEVKIVVKEFFTGNTNDIIH